VVVTPRARQRARAFPSPPQSSFWRFPAWWQRRLAIVTGAGSGSRVAGCGGIVCGAAGGSAEASGANIYTEARRAICSASWSSILSAAATGAPDLAHCLDPGPPASSA
jgi:hypothetical protein